MTTWLVALAQIRQWGLELRAVRVLAAAMVGEGAVQVDAIELAVGVLAQAADSDIADPVAA
jgi:hypothetical protein